MAKKEKISPYNTGFMKKLKDMNESERAQWYKERRDKIRIIKANRREEVFEWKKEVLVKLNGMLKEDTGMLDDPSVQPTDLTLYKIHEFLKSGFTITDIRDSMLANGTVSDTGWTKIKKALFDKHISRIEDLGIDIFSSQQLSIDLIDKEIRQLNKVRKAKPHDISLSKAIIEAADKRHKIVAELTKMFALAGVVGEKKKGGTTINIFSKTPRPPKEPIDVTPKIVELDEQTG